METQNLTRKQLHLSRDLLGEDGSRLFVPELSPPALLLNCAFSSWRGFLGLPNLPHASQGHTLTPPPANPAPPFQGFWNSLQGGLTWG